MSVECTRSAQMSRKTAETDITGELNVSGSGIVNIDTGIGFFDHMLTAFAVHGGFDLRFEAKGDLNVDCHHTVEDSGIVLGAMFAEAMRDKAGIARFGSVHIPMDEALVLAVADISGRPYFTGRDLPCGPMDGFDAGLAEEFFRAFAVNARITLHICVLYGKNPHHIIEACFKAAARALRVAVADAGGGVPSSKGVL